MSTASNWIGVHTFSRGRFLDSTQTWWFQKHLKSTSGYLTDVGGQRGGCQQLSQRKGACWLLNKKEALYGLIQVNDDEERNGCQQWYLGVSNPGYIPVYQKNSCTLLFSGLRSPYATGVLPTLFSVWIKRGWMNVFSRYL